jgi:hypothetical protein
MMQSNGITRSLRDSPQPYSLRTFKTTSTGSVPQEVTVALSTATLEPQVLRSVEHSGVRKRLAAEESQAATPGNST